MPTPADKQLSADARPATGDTSRRETRALIIVAVAVFALAAYRASVGMSFYDDSFYVAVPWRFAHGARFLIDELSLQTIGEMVSVPLVWVWERLFGLTGIVLAVRMLWVVVAAAGAWVATRLLGRSVTLAVAAFAVVLPLLAPAYHTFAPTYNTVSSLLLTLGVVLGFSAMRDDSRTLAVWAGVAVALGAASYPPLALAALVLLGTFVVMARSRRLAMPALISAGVTGVVVALALFAGTSLADLRTALAFGSANVPSVLTPAAKFSYALGNTAGALFQPLLWPMWVCALIACLRGVRSRLRAVLLGAIPLLAAAPGIWLLLRGDTLTFGTSTQSWLITTCAALLLPCLLAAFRLRRGDLVSFLSLAAPFSAVGYLTVAYVTNSSFNRGMPAIALAPLAVGLLMVWGTSLAEEGAPWLFPSAAGVALLIAFALLFSNVFGDESFWTAPGRVSRGAYAGLLTSKAHAQALDQFATRAPRWVNADTRVTFLGQAEGYLASGGRPLTPATWLFLGPADAQAIAYFNRVGTTPDVVFVSEADVADARRAGAAVNADPMLRWVQANYAKTDEIGGFSVYVRP